MPKEEARSSAVTLPLGTAQILADMLTIGSSPTITELWNLMRMNFLIEVSAPSHSSHPGYNIKVQWTRNSNDARPYARVRRSTSITTSEYLMTPRHIR